MLTNIRKLQLLLLGSVTLGGSVLHCTKKLSPLIFSSVVQYIQDRLITGVVSWGFTQFWAWSLNYCAQFLNQINM